MRDEQLHALLRHADRGVRPAPIRGDVATGARRRIRRNRAVRAAGGVAALAAFGALSLMLARPHPPAAPELALATPPLELDLLDQQIRIHELTVGRLLTREEQRVTRTTPALGPLEELQQHRDSAAAILLHQADWLNFELKQSDQAAVEYRRMIELFPETAAAFTASQRLEQLPA